MKLDKLKKLFRAKRVIALALAAAMTVTSLPQTAYAAEADTPETETAVEVQEEEEPAQDTEEQESSAEENKESASSEAEDAESSAEEAASETTDADEAKETTVSQEADNQAEGDAAADDATDVVWTLDITELDSDSEVKTAVYDGDLQFGGSTPDYKILSKINIKKNDEVKNLGLSYIQSHFIYKWQKDGTDTDPVNAGKYQLVITPVEGGDYASAAPKTVTGFVIEKADVDIQFGMEDIKPGTAPDKVKDSISYVQVYNKKTGQPDYALRYTPADETSPLTVTDVTVIDPLTNNAISEQFLRKNGDYSVKITVNFSNKATDEQTGNYNLPATGTGYITVADLKATTLTLEPITGAGKAECIDNSGVEVQIISKIYDGTEAAVPAYKEKVEEKDIPVDENGKAKDPVRVTPKEGEVSGAWHSAAFRSWKETAEVPQKDADGSDKTDPETGEVIYDLKETDYCSLTVGGELEEGTKPVEAGTYVYRVSYKGDKEQYAGSYADIVVEITPDEVEVVPTADGATFYAGEKVEDVLTKIDWKLNKEIKAENIWGTSYDEYWKTQPYVPVFGVYEVQGKAATKLSDKDVLKKDTQYEVRFTGKKTVRNENGYKNEKDINDARVDSFNSNYKTSTDEAKNPFPFTASDKNVNISVDISSAAAKAGLTKSDTKIADEEIYTRVFSENRVLFENRADYKVATVNGSDEHLTYKWYKWLKSDDITETYVEVFNEKWDSNFKGKSLSDWDPLNINDEDFLDNMGDLHDAGIYKLEITYDDGTAYAQKNVYFAIEPQQLRYVPTEVLKAHYGAFTEDYVRSNRANEKFAPKLQINQNNADNDGKGDWKDAEDIIYMLESDDWWEVQKKAPDEKDPETGETISSDWGWTNYFEFLTAGEEGKTVEQNKYRLAYEALEIEINGKENNPNYTFYKYTAKELKSSTGKTDDSSKKKLECVSEILSVKEIEVEKAGEKELHIKLPEKEIASEKVYDGEPIKVDLSGVKLLDSDEKEVQLPLQFIWEWNYDDIVSPEEAIDGGTYAIYAFYEGDSNYAPVEGMLVATATITQREITVSVKQTEEIQKKAVAGKKASDIYSDYSSGEKAGDILEFTGVIDADKDFFTWTKLGDSYGYPAWLDSIWIEDNEIQYGWLEKPSLAVYGSDGNKLDRWDKLEGGEKYTLKVDTDTGWMADPYSLNYTLKADKSAEVTAAYAKSTVFLRSVQTKDNVTEGETEKFTHDVTLLESIPYGEYPIDGKKVYGHYATVYIRIPEEFNDVSDTMFYENALKNAGAVNVYKLNVYERYICADFNFSKDGENGLEPNPVEFKIAWKPGFVEAFKIDPKDNLAADLRNAVAPKSIAFNAPKTKMVVGEVQDLDVKITKVQNDDLVYLDYRIVDGADVVAISSQGRVTALKEGNATVEVYPVKIANNQKVAITEGTKPAQVKIAISKVAAPKVGTVTPADESVKVEYPYVKNNGKYYDYGYRREVYVMPENKVTVEQFDKAIAKFEQTGDYKAAGLAAEPVYIANDTEQYIAGELAKGIYTEYECDIDDRLAGFAKGKNVTLQVEVRGLTPKTPYTVYVRNVSAQRTVLDKDGSKKIAQLSANGTLKDFKTTLGQVKLLQVKVDEGENADSARPAFLHMYDAEEEGFVRRLVRYYEYDLANTVSTQLSVWGAFSAIEAADEGDEKAEDVDLSAKVYRLPLADPAMKAKLLDPKIDYHMYQVTQNSDGSWNYVTHNYYDEINGEWRYADEYDWNGNVAFQTAAKYTKADKKGALKFAQPEAIAVTAYDTVTKTESAPIIVRINAAADSAVGKKVTLQVGQTTSITDLVTYKSGKYALDSLNPYFAHNATATGNAYLDVDAENGTITPVIFDKASAKQTVPVTGDPTVSGAAEITIKELDPVKNLKFNNLIDNSFDLEFAPSIYAEGYIVDIKNARGSLVQRKYIEQYDDMWYYSAKKKAYVLADEDDKWLFRIDGLKTQCKYTVSVTAVYGDAASKPASKAITTTKLPAWDTALGANAVNEGMSISVLHGGDVYGYTFVSGNRYTLIADAHQGAAYAVTDKLTWSSSDSKVAKITALGGTYSAALKALKPGTTTIEVKSGILKQTIARWTITVRSVGDAYNNAHFYDENEDLRGDGTDQYPTEAKLVLNVPAAVELAAGESKIYAFTAEETGKYEVVGSAGMGVSVRYSFTPNNELSWTYYPPESGQMSKGSTIYVKIIAGDEPASGTITVEKVTGNTPQDRTPLKLNESVTIPAGGWAVFMADDDDNKLYNFAGTGTMKLYKNLGGESVKSGSSIDYAIKKKATVYVENISSSNNTIKVTAVGMAELKTGEKYDVKKSTAYWYTFKPSEDGDYRFKKADNFTISVYSELEDINSGSSSSQPVNIKADKTVYVKAYSGSKDTSFTVEKVVPVEIDDGNKEYTDSVEAYDTTLFSVKSTVDAVYTFTVSSSVNAIGLYLDGEMLTEKTKTISYPLKAGKTYSIKVDNTNSSSKKTLTVSNTAIGALDIAGEPKGFTPAGVGSSVGYLTFTVPADGEGTYKFDLKNLSYSNNYLGIMDEPSDESTEYIKYQTVSSTNNSMECYLLAGKKVWLRISGSYNPSSVTAAVTKVGDAIKPLPTEGAVTVEAGKTAWFSHKITESGKYSFIKTGSSNAKVTVYEDIDKQEEIKNANERYWKSGSTVYLKLTNSSTTTNAEVTIKPDKVTPEAWTDNPIIEGYATKWYKITAPNECIMKFTGSSAAGYDGGRFYLYTTKQFESVEDSVGVDYDSVSYLFDQGETVYLKVYNNRSAELTLTVKSITLTDITGGENPVTTADNGAVMKFTAPKTGIYTFEPNGSGYLYLYADKESYRKNVNQQYADYDSLCYPLMKGATVYIKLSDYYDEETEYKLTVSSEEMQEVTFGANKLALEAYKGKWLCYTVADDAKYNYIYASYTSDDSNVGSLQYEYKYYFDDNNWKDYMNSNSMYNNSNGIPIYHYGEKMLIIKLKPYNSGTITFNISDKSN